MLNKQAIHKALTKGPLCKGTLTKTVGMAREYCAMAALCKGVGVGDKELEQSSGSGEELWHDYGDKLRDAYGITSLEQFQSFMHVNDATEYSTRRNNAVLSHVEALTAAEVDNILAAPVSAETKVNI